MTNCRRPPPLTVGRNLFRTFSMTRPSRPWRREFRQSRIRITICRRASRQRPDKNRLFPIRTMISLRYYNRPPPSVEQHPPVCHYQTRTMTKRRSDSCHRIIATVDEPPVIKLTSNRLFICWMFPGGTIVRRTLQINYLPLYQSIGRVQTSYVQWFTWPEDHRSRAPWHWFLAIWDLGPEHRKSTCPIITVRYNY